MRAEDCERCREVLPELEKLRAENACLKAEQLRLTKLVEELREKAGLNSQNSSLPPASDRPDAPVRIAKPPTGRKPGGQPGHPRHERTLLPPEKVTRTLVFKPPKCRACGCVLLGDDPRPQRWQHVEIPEPKPEVTECEQHTLECLNCQERTTASVPDWAPRGPWGVRLLATMALLVGGNRQSRRLVVSLMKDLFGIAISLGSVSASEKTVSAAIAKPVEEAVRHVQEAAIKNADETSWKEGAKRLKVWLWVAYTAQVTVFKIQASRSEEAARNFLGKVLGILVTDRLASYNWWPLWLRQVCWSHLKRDFQKIVDRGGESLRIGEALQAKRTQLFLWWHRIRDGTLSRATFGRYVAELRQEVKTLLLQGSVCSHPKTARTCAKLLQIEPALWTFVRVPGVEPTNNSSERAVRPAVIMRKLCFGSHSPDGSRFVERMLTVITSLRQQDRDVLGYLMGAIKAAQENRAAPSILPAHRTA